MDPESSHLQVAVPHACNAHGTWHRAALFDAILRMACRLKHVRMECNPADGEVRMAVDMPVGDGNVTASQLRTMVLALWEALEQFHGVIQHVMEAGESDMERRLSARHPGNEHSDDGGSQDG